MKLGSLFDGIGGFPAVAEMYGIEATWASEVEPSCIRITNRHFPNMEHVGDITKLDGGKLKPVDIVTGGSPCFPAGTMVLTSRGYVPIETVQVGDIVLTHLGNWKPVTAVGNHVDRTYVLKGNVTIETTANHPIYSACARRKYYRKPNGIGRNVRVELSECGNWTAASDMARKYWATPNTVVECLQIPKPDVVTINQKPFPDMDSGFWYFVGRWLGDGWVRDGFRKEKPNGLGHGAILICDSIDKESELIETVKHVSENYSISHERGCARIRFTSQLLCNWLVENFGKGAANKRIPGFVYSLDTDSRVALLSGIIDSDGCKIRKSAHRITSVSKSMILGIRMLAESLGYSTSVTTTYPKPHKIIEGRLVNQNTVYCIVITKNDNKGVKLRTDTHHWYICKSVKQTSRETLVYNISVLDDESYIADSIVVHNCQDMSVAGQQAGIGLKCVECGTIVEFSDDADVCPKCGAALESTRSGLFLEQVRVIQEMREATNGEYPKVCVWENVCFSGDTLVTCDNGYKRIDAVKVGDNVKTKSGKYHKVVATHTRESVQLYRLQPTGSIDTYVTANHPVFVKHRLSDGTYGGPVLARVDELRVGDLVGYVLDVDTMVPSDTPSYTDCEMLGRKIALTEDEPDVQFPQYVFKLPKTQQALVASGYCDENRYATTKFFSDYVTRNVATQNRSVAHGIARIFRNIYRTPVVMDVETLPDGSEVYYVSVMIGGESYGGHYEDGVVWQPVIYVHPTNRFEKVYNLSVMEDNTYEANGFICHNCGAFSSNNGDDFHIVLKEFCKLISEELPSHRPEKWTYAGEILGATGSIAWRTFDAQYWGVPQRRRRIYLVIDFGGQRAGEILFKQESLRGYSTSSEAAWKRTSGTTSESFGTTDPVRTTAGENDVTSNFTLDNQRELNGPLCVATQQVNAEILVGKCPTLTEANGTSGSNRPYLVLDDQGGQNINTYTDGIVPTLRAETHGHVPCVVHDTTVYGISSYSSNSMKSDNPNSGVYETDVAKTLDTSGTNPSCNQGGNVVVQTPVYCLQGNGIDRADTAGCNGKGWKEDVCYTLNTVDRPAVAYSVSENGSQAVWISKEVASTLTTGGGKPGQGYCCVLVDKNDGDESASIQYAAGFAHQVGGKLPMMPFNDELSPTLTAYQTMAVLVENHPADSRVTLSADNVCQTLSARMGTGGGNVPMVLEETAEVYGEGAYGDYVEGRFSTLKASGGVYGGGSETFVAEPIVGTVGGFMQFDTEVTQIVQKPNSIVRRITPIEAERLQGFPDNWTAGESDANRYKALGNSVALPCVDYVIRGILDVLEPVT